MSNSTNPEIGQRIRTGSFHTNVRCCCCTAPARA
jgi:hypothetical protein